MTRKLLSVLVLPVLSEKLTLYSKKDQTRWVTTFWGNRINSARDLASTRGLAQKETEYSSL